MLSSRHQAAVFRGFHSAAVRRNNEDQEGKSEAPGPGGRRQVQDEPDQETELVEWPRNSAKGALGPGSPCPATWEKSGAEAMLSWNSPPFLPSRPQ